MKYILDGNEIEITNFDDYIPLGNDGKFVYVRRKTQEDFDKERIAEIKPRLEELSQDLVQDMAGEVVPDILERKAEFVELHNELRVLLGKEKRELKEE